MHAPALILVLFCCSLACTDCQEVRKAPADRKVFYDGETCVKYCEVPCVRTPVRDSPYPTFLHYCKKFNPLGAGKSGTAADVSGWLQVALIVIGVFGCCVFTAVVYLWQKGRRLCVKPSGGGFENIDKEEV